MGKSYDSSVGLMVRFGKLQESFQCLKDLGLSHCQLVAPPDEYLYGEEGKRNTAKLRETMKELKIEATSLFISFPNQDWKDWRNGVGLVPPATRAERIARACRSADWARELGIKQIASHVGCVPEDASDPVYKSFIEAMRGLCLLIEANGQVLAYETGQESLATLRRTMADIGTLNQRINFDPANLLIYDQDDPMEFVESAGELIVHVHCKDACRPAKKGELGREVRLGDGETRFKELLKALLRRGYRGPLTIEREIAPGPELVADTKHAIALIESIEKEMKEE